MISTCLSHSRCVADFNPLERKGRYYQDKLEELNLPFQLYEMNSYTSHNTEMYYIRKILVIILFYKYRIYPLFVYGEFYLGKP